MFFRKKYTPYTFNKLKPYSDVNAIKFLVQRVGILSSVLQYITTMLNIE